MQQVILLSLFFGIIIVIFVFLYQSKWSVEISYRYPEMQAIQIHIYFYRWCVKRNVLQLHAEQLEKSRKDFKHFPMLFQNRHYMQLAKKPSVRQLLKEMDVIRFCWQTKGGTGDVISTSVASGMLWTIKGAILAYLSQHMNLRHKPELDIKSDFQNICFETNFSCMISFRLGNTIRRILSVLNKEEV